jgi:hypothetical protein
MMLREPLCVELTVTLTPSDREALGRMAQAHGATLRGTIRKLIRDAAEHEISTLGKSGGRDATRNQR